MLLASLPAFIGGTIEDVTSRVSPFLRMVATLASIVIAFVWLGVGIDFLGFEWADYYLSNYVILSFLFSLLVIGGTVNAVNIIDGYNGLMPGYSILVLLAIAYVSNVLGDVILLHIILLFLKVLHLIKRL